MTLPPAAPSPEEARPAPFLTRASSRRLVLGVVALTLLLTLPSSVSLALARNSGAGVPRSPDGVDLTSSPAAKAIPPATDRTPGRIEPDQIGPVSRSLWLYNNTVVGGAVGALKLVTPSHISVAGPLGDLLVDSQITSSLEQFSPSGVPRAWTMNIPSGDYGSANDTTNGLIYVAGGYSGNVTVVDPQTQTIVAVATSVGQVLSSALYDPAVNEVLLTDFTAGTLIFFDPTSDVAVRTIGVGQGPISTTLDPVNGEVFVVNSGSNNVTVVDPSLRVTVGSAGTGPSPLDAVYLPHYEEVAVVNSATDNLTLFNATTWKLVFNPVVGASPEGIAFDPDTRTLLVANYGSNNVSEVDPATNRSVGQLQGYYLPNLVAYDPATDQVLIVNQRTDNVTVLQGTTLAVVSNVPLADAPADVAYDTNHDQLYIINDEPGAAVEVDPVTFHVEAWIPVGDNPTAGFFDPTDDEVLVADTGFAAYGFPGNLSIINAATQKVVATLPTMPQPSDVVYDPDNGLVYVADTDSAAPTGGVTVIDPTTLKNVENITVGVCSDPDGIAYDPADQMIILGCGGSDVFDVIDTLSAMVVSTINTGGATTNARYDPVNNDLYVTGSENDVIEVFNATTLSLVTTIPTGVAEPLDVDVDTDDGFVAVAMETANQAWLIPPNNTAPFKVDLATPPDAIGFDPVQGTFIVDSDFGGTTYEFPVLTSEVERAVPAVVDAGEPTTLEVILLDGGATLTISYGGLPAGCLSANTSYLSCTPTVPGTYTVDALVTDVYGKWAEANVTFTVDHDMTVGLSAAPNPVGVGETSQFTATATLGTPPYSFAYEDLPPGCSASGTGPTLGCAATSPGTYQVGVVVSDHGEGNETAWTNLTVVGGPVITSFQVSPTVGIVGSSSTLSVLASGGLAPLSYSYTGLPAGCSSSDDATLSCVPGAPGWYNVTATVTDAASAHDSDTLAVDVVSVMTLTGFSASPSSLTLGGNTTISVSIAGGRGPYSVDWFGLSPGGSPVLGCAERSSQVQVCTPTQTGTFMVGVVVLDLLGEVARAHLNLTVTAAPTTSSSGLSLWEIAGAGVGAAVVVAVLALLLLARRRKAKQEPATPPGASEWDAGAQASGPAGYGVPSGYGGAQGYPPSGGSPGYYPPGYYPPGPPQGPA